MARRLLKVVILVFVSLTPLLAFASSSSIETGVSWITTTQNSDGSWGSNAELAVLDTSVALDTLKNMNFVSPSYSSAVTWLSSQSALPNDFLSRKIVSLYAAGVDISAGLSALITSRNADGGWGGDSESTSMINDTVLILQALKAVS